MLVNFFLHIILWVICIKDIVGNTPLIKINYKYKDREGFVYAKLEWFNITGSIKDRLVKYILDVSIKEGLLKKGQEICEATSGNTGISLSAFGTYYGHKVTIFMPDFVSEERVKLIKSYGASVVLVSREDGGFKKCIELANKYSNDNNAFLFNQFNNKLNIECHYNMIGNEIVDDLDKIDAFVSGIGSGGTYMGVSKKIKEVYNNSELYLVEPYESPLFRDGSTNRHKIEGIGDDFIPDIVDKKLIENIISIHSDDAINMSKLLSFKLGLGVGISSGANFLASVIVNQKKNNVVTVFSDDNKKYLSTDLFNDINVKDYFISNDIELIDFEII